MIQRLASRMTFINTGPRNIQNSGLSGHSVLQPDPNLLPLYCRKFSISLRKIVGLRGWRMGLEGLLNHRTRDICWQILRIGFVPSCQCTNSLEICITVIVRTAKSAVMTAFINRTVVFNCYLYWKPNWLMLCVMAFSLWCLYASPSFCSLFLSGRLSFAWTVEGIEWVKRDKKLRTGKQSIKTKDKWRL
jgi:hypothetical protein